MSLPGVLRTERQLAAAQTPAERVAAQNALAWELIRTEPMRARALGEEVYQLAQELGDLAGIAGSLLVLGTHQIEFDATDRALETLQEALELCRQVDDPVQLARALDSLGWCQYIRGEYSEALDVHLQALSLRHEIGNSEEIADSLNSLSAVYCDVGKYADGAEHMLRALELAEEYNDPVDLTRFLVNIGTLYMEVGEYEQAIEMLTRGRELAHKINYVKVETFAISTLAEVHALKGNYPLALEYAHIALQTPEEIMPKYLRSETLIYLGDVYRHLGDFDQAERYLLDGLILCSEIGDTTTDARGKMCWGALLIDRGNYEEGLESLQEARQKAEKADFLMLSYQIYEELARAYALNGNFQAAFESYRQYHTIKETVFSRDTITRRRLYEMQLSLRQVRQEHQIAEALRQAGTELNAVLDLEQVLDLMLNQMREILPYDAATIYRVEDEQIVAVRCREYHENGITHSCDSVLQLQQVTGLHSILVENQPFNVDDIALFPSVYEWLPVAKMRSLVGAPLLIKGKLIALVLLMSATPNTFQHRHAEFLAIYASQAALAIENARLFSEIQRLAITDGLTGMYNRRHLFDLGALEFETSQKYNQPLSAIMLDIDLFKKYNDTYGHLVGDEVIRRVSAVLKASLKPGYVLGRYGGEEFVLLMPDTFQPRALEQAERMRQVVEALDVTMGDLHLHPTISVGVAERQPGHTRLEGLINAADEAMYRSKQSGRNRVSI